jgi:hypothetical protein
MGINKFISKHGKTKCDAIFTQLEAGVRKMTVRRAMRRAKPKLSIDQEIAMAVGLYLYSEDPWINRSIVAKRLPVIRIIATSAS